MISHSAKKQHEHKGTAFILVKQMRYRRVI